MIEINFIISFVFESLPLDNRRRSVDGSILPKVTKFDLAWFVDSLTKTVLLEKILRFVRHFSLVCEQLLNGFVNFTTK